MRFAGFIITYNRPEQLASTISKILDQTFAPEKLWIIDNSDNDATESLVRKLDDSRLKYFRVGYNAGPAMAVNIALKQIPSGKYDWIFWGDDDDPPPAQDTFQKQFEALRSLPELTAVGQLGIVGHRLNLKTGIIDQVKNNELEGEGVVLVDNIAGGQSKIIRGSLFEEGVRISSELFYGFEELDFDIQVKKLGYRSIVPKELYRRQRYHPLREEIIREKLLSKETIWRQYYSTRNLLFIYQKHRLYTALVYLLARKFIKLPLEFRKGWDVGLTSAKYNLLGVAHWILGLYGKRV